MKAVMLSLRPQWCEKIFNGSKTIEVRKTRPLIDMPFKVYVYCMKQKLTKTKCMHSYLHKNEPKACKKYGEITTWCSIGDVHVNSNTPWSFRSYGMHGKVIGSFVCDKIEKIDIQAQITTTLSERWTFNGIAKQACLTAEQLKEYLNGDTGYGWHITAPTLFEKPRDITEFAIFGKCADECSEYDFCARDIAEDRVACKCFKRSFLKRPPQSWCYIEGE